MRIGRAMADASQTSRKRGNFLGRLLMLLALSFAMVVQPAMAQSVLRDAETEAFFRDMSRPLKEAAGLQPDNVQIVLLHSDDINAFVAGGQVVYVFSGDRKSVVSGKSVSVRVDSGGRRIIKKKKKKKTI